MKEIITSLLEGKPRYYHFIFTEFDKYIHDHKYWSTLPSSLLEYKVHREIDIGNLVGLYTTNAIQQPHLFYDNIIFQPEHTISKALQKVLRDKKMKKVRVNRPWLWKIQAGTIIWG